MESERRDERDQRLLREVQTASEAPGSFDIADSDARSVETTDGSMGPTWGRQLLAVILLAAWVRVIASVIAACFVAAGNDQVQASLGHSRLVNVVRWLCDFGDGNGTWICLAIIGLIWWQTQLGPDNRTLPSSYAIAAHAAIVLTAVAAIGYGVALVIPDWAGDLRGARLVGSGGFYAAYTLIDGWCAVVVYRLQRPRYFPDEAYTEEDDAAPEDLVEQ